MQPDKIKIYRSLLSRRSQRYRWRRVAPNGRKVATSGEGYYDRWHCLEMARRCAGMDGWHHNVELEAE